MELPMMAYVMVFFFSLFLGSFYNVVALRTLSGESIVSPKERSHCTSCGHNLTFFDMVPVFSWLVLGGKCRYCREHVSPLYPYGELLTAVSYTLVVWTFGFTMEALIQLVFMTIMIWASVADAKEGIVPNRFVVIGLTLVGALRVANGVEVGTYFLSGLIAFGILLLILILSGGRMGGADVKLYALIGLAIGVGGALGSLFYASFLVVLVSLPALVKRKKLGKIPFVPYMTAGILLTYIVNVYSFLNL